MAVRYLSKKIRLHTINDDPHKRLHRHGRAILHVGWLRFSTEWAWRSGNQPQAMFIVGGEDRSFGFQLVVPFVGWWSADVRVLPERWHWKVWPNKRETGIRFGGYKRLGTLYLWHHETHSWTRGEVRWTEWNLFAWGRLADRLLGRVEVIKEPLQVVQTIIPMPEGAYPAKVKLERWTWKRKRWFGRSKFMSDVTPETPIPVPGKGTESYNCDDDAIWSSSGAHNTVHGAVTDFVGSVLRSRQNYGGSIEWQPRNEETLQLRDGTVAWVTPTLVTCGKCGFRDATMQCGVQGEERSRVFCHECGGGIKCGQPLPEDLR